MTQSSFYGDTPNYATDYPTQNDGNTNPANGNSTAPSSMYPNGGIYEALADSDTVLAEMQALEAQAATDAANAATSASGAASSASAAATSAANAAAAVQAAAGTATPSMDGVVATVGTGTKWAHEDHVHPTDTTRADAAATTAALALKAPLSSPTFTGTPTAPTASVGTNTTQIATTAFVLANSPSVPPATAAPLMDGVAAVGVATKYAREDHVHPTDTSRAALASPSLTGTPTAPTAAPGTNTTQLATTAFVLANAPALDTTLLRGHLAGCILSTAGSSATFSVSAGVANDSTSANLMKLASSISKTTGAWGVGTGNGSLDTGTIAASTWYHVYQIKRTDTGVVDVLISLSATAPTLPSPYTLFRRIGAMKTNGSSQWTKFVQLGDEFLWDTPVGDVNTTFGTTSTLYTLSVPTGVQVNALCRIMTVNNSVPSGSVFSSPDEATQVAGTPAGNYTIAQAAIGNYGGAPHNIRTNTSAQIRGVCSANSTTLQINTNGWVDLRGRYA
jgi:hypothetical protein